MNQFNYQRYKQKISENYPLITQKNKNKLIFDIEKRLKVIIF